MNTITLKVNDENLDILLTILKNLKPELIVETQLNGKSTQSKPTHYQPKTNTIISEELGRETQGKYLNPNAFKQRLKRK